MPSPFAEVVRLSFHQMITMFHYVEDFNLGGKFELLNEKITNEKITKWKCCDLNMFEDFITGHSLGHQILSYFLMLLWLVIFIKSSDREILNVVILSEQTRPYSLQL